MGCGSSKADDDSRTTTSTSVAAKSTPLFSSPAADVPSVRFGAQGTSGGASTTLQGQTPPLMRADPSSGSLLALKFAGRLKYRVKQTRKRRQAMLARPSFGRGQTFHDLGADSDDDWLSDDDASDDAEEGEDESPLPEDQIELVLQALPDALSHLTPRSLRLVFKEIASAGRQRCYEGRQLLARGRPLEKTFIVLSGRFETYSKEVDPSMLFALHRFEAGSAIGEAALTSTRPPKSPFAVKCVEAGVVLSLSGKAYRGIVDHTIKVNGTRDTPTFLSALPCCAYAPKALLEEVAAEPLRVCETRDILTDIIARSHSSHSIFIVMRGATKIALMRPPEERTLTSTPHAKEKVVVFKPGDILGKGALAACEAALVSSEKDHRPSVLQVDGLVERLLAPQPNERVTSAMDERVTRVSGLLSDADDGLGGGAEAAPSRGSASRKSKGAGGGGGDGKTTLLEISAGLLKRDDIHALFAREANRCFMRKVLKTMGAFKQFNFDELERILHVAHHERFVAGSHIQLQPPPDPSVAPGDPSVLAPAEEENKKDEGPSSRPSSSKLYIVVQGVAIAWRRRTSPNEEEADFKMDASEAWRQEIEQNEVLQYYCVGEVFGSASFLDPSTPPKETVTAHTDLVCLTLTSHSQQEDAHTNALGSGGDDVLQRLGRGLSRDVAHRQWQLHNRHDKIRWSDVQTGVTLGEGAFGVVKAAKIGTSHVYALKCLRKLHVFAAREISHVNNECELLETLSHPFLLQQYAAYQDANKLYLLLELVPGGELFSLHQAGTFSLHQARFYAACVVSAIAHLNTMSIVYRDIKLENLILDAQGYVKVVDFGFAKVVDHRTYTFCGTAEYMAPEIVQSRPHHLPVDWWSIGVLTFEMLVGTTPFDADAPVDVFQKMLSYVALGEPAPAFPWFFNASAKAFVLELLVAEPSERLSAAEMSSHPFLSALDPLALEARSLAAPYVPKIDGDANHFDSDQYDDESEEEDEDQDSVEALDDGTKKQANQKHLEQRMNPKLFPAFVPREGTMSSTSNTGARNSSLFCGEDWRL